MTKHYKRGGFCLLDSNNSYRPTDYSRLVTTETNFFNAVKQFTTTISFVVENDKNAPMSLTLGGNFLFSHHVININQQGVILVDNQGEPFPLHFINFAPENAFLQKENVPIPYTDTETDDSDTSDDNFQL